MKNKNIISIFENGPIHITGNLSLKESDGDVIEETNELFLCRCGQSEDKPYCDGKHKETNFSESGKFIKPPESEKDISDEGTLDIKVQANGPLIFKGLVLVQESAGEEIYRKVGGLCRCGQSNNSPFCDGTHAKVDFIAD